MQHLILKAFAKTEGPCSKIFIVVLADDKRSANLEKETGEDHSDQMDHKPSGHSCQASLFLPLDVILSLLWKQLDLLGTSLKTSLHKYFIKN